MRKEHIEIFLLKIDQLRDGAWVAIACTGTPLCPVAMLERYKHMGRVLLARNATSEQ
jgi:hypothetical protein